MRNKILRIQELNTLLNEYYTEREELSDRVTFINFEINKINEKIEEITNSLLKDA